MAARKLSGSKALSPATPRLPGLPGERPGRCWCQTARRFGEGRHRRPPLRPSSLAWMGDEPAPGRSGRNGHGRHTQPHHQGDQKAGTRGARVDPLTDAAGSRADRARRPVDSPVPGQRRAGRTSRDGGLCGGHGRDRRSGCGMLPTGAAAGASARILRSLPDQDTVADDHHGNLNGHPDNGRVPTRTAANTGHADPPPPRQVRCPGPCVSSGPTRTTLPNASWHPSNERHADEQGVRLSRWGPGHQGSRGGRTGGVAIYSEG